MLPSRDGTCLISHHKSRYRRNPAATFIRAGDIMFCSIAFVAALFSFCEPNESLAVGYVEGEYVLVAPIETARIRALLVERGQKTEAGAILVEMERRDTEILASQAEAAVARARAELADLQRGARDAEIAVAAAAVESARADLDEAEREFARIQVLFERNVAAQSQLDLARAKREIAQARLQESEARLAVLRLPAREGRIAAVEAASREAAAKLEAAQWRLAQRMLNAPVSGVVADVFRFPGDLAGPQAPVLSILPENGIKLRFYVPEPNYADVRLGDEVAFRCDGCPDGLRATISYLATNPEFTPPVIYSLNARQKLVYLAEARFDTDTGTLKPGQIVDVLLPEVRE
jgi:HlyD family secretion protein